MTHDLADVHAAAVRGRQDLVDELDQAVRARVALALGALTALVDEVYAYDHHDLFDRTPATAGPLQRFRVALEEAESYAVTLSNIGRKLA